VLFFSLSLVESSELWHRYGLNFRLTDDTSLSGKTVSYSCTVITAVLPSKSKINARLI
jgi:hypothetical protein